MASDKTPKPNAAEELLANWHDGLHALYHRSLDDDEASEPCPILSDLKRGGGRYERGELLATGGEKRIYRVKDRLMARQLAMAVPREKSDAAKERFLREARVTARLRHPHILGIHDVGLDEDGVPFFTMDWIDGLPFNESVVAWRADNGFEAERVIKVLLKVCDAVIYAHAAGVLHLDIKPGNIHVGAFGEVLLCDWGLAKVRHDDSVGDDGVKISVEEPLSDMTLAGTVKGTPGYMAPEQTGQGGQKTVLTDVYALGAVLHFALTGQPPVAGATIEDVIAQTRAGFAATQATHELPSGLEAIIVRGLSVAPEARYPTVSAFRDALVAYLVQQEKRSHIEHGLRTAVDLLFKKSPKTGFEDRLSTILTEKSLRFSRVSAYQSTIALLEQLLVHDPAHVRAWRHLACVRFVVLDFAGAAEAFAKGAEAYAFCQEMLPIARRHAAEFSERRALTPPEMADILADGPDDSSWYWIQFHLLIHDEMQRQVFLEHVEVVRAYLKIRNPGLKTLNFEFSEVDSERHLSLANSRGLRYLTIPGKLKRSGLQTLELHTLDIRGTDIATDELRGLSDDLRVIQTH